MDREVPGSGQISQAYEPASSPAVAGQVQAPPQTPPTAAGEPGSSSGQTPDYESIIRQREAEAQAAQQRAQQLEQTLSKVQQWAQQTEQQQQEQQRRTAFQDRKKQILQRAGSMRADEADRFIESEMDNLYNEFQQQTQTLAQQFQQQQQQTIRQLATPLYIQDLAKKHGLPESAAQELTQISGGDPDAALRMVGWVKQRHDERQQLEERLSQLSRTQTANNVHNSGVTQLGGYNAPTGFDVPDGLDADERAGWILHQLRQNS